MRTPEERRAMLLRAAQIEARTNDEIADARAAWERQRAASEMQQVTIDELEALATARDDALAQLQKMKIEHNKVGATTAAKVQAQRGVMRMFNEILETIA